MKMISSYRVCPLRAHISWRRIIIVECFLSQMWLLFEMFDRSRSECPRRKEWINRRKGSNLRYLPSCDSRERLEQREGRKIQLKGNWAVDARKLMVRDRKRNCSGRALASEQKLNVGKVSRAPSEDESWSSVSSFLNEIILRNVGRSRRITGRASVQRGNDD